MAFIRRVRTASGATAVQVAEYVGGRTQRIVAHVGSARTEAELGIVMARARELLEDSGQGELDLGLEPVVRKAPLVEPLAGEQALFPAAGEQAVGAAPGAAEAVGPGRVTGTSSRVLFDALAGVYDSLGFGALGDEVFRDLVIARVVEPSSLADAGRVLGEMGREAASYSTLRRTLRRAAGGGYRDRIADACFARALRDGDVSLCL